MGARALRGEPAASLSLPADLIGRFIKYEESARDQATRSTSTTSSGARSRPPGRRWPLARVARPLRHAARRRGAGRRPNAARARAHAVPRADATSSSSATTTRRSTRGAWPTCAACSAWPAAPGLKPVDLVTNHRCPRPVVERAVRLIENNQQRFAKGILAATGCPGRPPAPDATATRPPRTPEYADGPTARVRAPSWPAPTGSLRPAVLAAMAVGEAFRSARRRPARRRPGAGTACWRAWLRQDGPAATIAGPARGTSRRGRRGRDGGRTRSCRGPPRRAPPYADLGALVAAIGAMRACLVELRRDDARLSLATAHSTKGAEFDHVAVIGMEEGRFPSGRAVAQSDEPDRALEEERRLGYVAWTRARRTLTLSYDPAILLPVPAGGIQPGRARPRRRCRRLLRVSSSNG